MPLTTPARDHPTNAFTEEAPHPALAGLNGHESGDRAAEHLEASRALLGALLINGAAFAKVAPLLRPEDIPGELRKIFVAMGRVVEQGGMVDPVTLRAADPSIDLVLLAELEAGVPYSRNAEAYGQLVRDHAKVSRLAQLLRDPELTAAQVLQAAGRIGLTGHRAGAAPALTRLADLLEEPVPEHRHVVDGMLPVAGTSAWGGKPKVGKDTALRNCVLHLARGALFLGRRTLAGPALYFAHEDNRAEVAAHFRVMGARDEPVYVYTGAAPHDPWAYLESVVDRHRPVFVGISPIGRFVRVKDWNDYAEVSEKLDPPIRLAAESGAHFAFGHHAGKVERDGGDAFLGSTAIYGTVDTALVLRRDEQTGVRTIETRQRYGDDLPASVLHLDKATGLVSLGRDRRSEEEQAVRDRLCQLLAVQAMSETAIREEEKSRLVPKVLRTLVAEGVVTRSGKGRPGDPYIYASR